NTHDWTYTYTVDIPDFTLPADGGTTVDCPADALVAPTAPEVRDACDNLLTPTNTPPTGIACEGEVVWVFTYTDCEGNTHDWTYKSEERRAGNALRADGGTKGDCPSDA